MFLMDVISESDIDNADERKDITIKFYKQAMAEAKESKVSTFFKALTPVEECHLDLLNGSEETDK